MYFRVGDAYRDFLSVTVTVAVVDQKKRDPSVKFYVPIGERWPQRPQGIPRHSRFAGASASRQAAAPQRAHTLSRVSCTKGVLLSTCGCAPLHVSEYLDSRRNRWRNAPKQNGEGIASMSPQCEFTRVRRSTLVTRRIDVFWGCFTQRRSSTEAFSVNIYDEMRLERSARGCERGETTAVAGEVGTQDRLTSSFELSR